LQEQEYFLPNVYTQEFEILGDRAVTEKVALLFGPEMVIPP